MELKRIVQSRFWNTAWLVYFLKTMNGILSKTFSRRKRIKLKLGSYLTLLLPFVNRSLGDLHFNISQFNLEWLQK